MEVNRESSESSEATALAGAHPTLNWHALGHSKISGTCGSRETFDSFAHHYRSRSIYAIGLALSTVSLSDGSH